MTTQASERKIMEAVEDAREDSDKLEGYWTTLLAWNKVELIKVKIEGNDK